MAVRNCNEIGKNLSKIVNRLLNNDNLVKLLYYCGRSIQTDEYGKIYEKETGKWKTKKIV